MRSLTTRRALAGLATVLALGLPALAAAQAAATPAPAATTAPAADAAPRGAPAGFTAPAEPKADETNAQRAVSQPGNNAPMWRAVQQSGTTPGTSTLPGAEKGVLIQPFVQYPGSRYTTAGEAWRQVRNQWLIPYGGSLLLIAVVALGLFYFGKGPLGGHLQPTGRQIERFTPFERAAHGVNAVAFVVLGISGIVMAWGKYFLLPILGGTLFGWLAFAMKNLHNFVGPLFAVSLVVVVLTFVKDNIANKADFVWLSKAGGMLGDEEVPSHRFNAGEKGMFWWGVCIPGLLVVGSGLVLDLLIPGWGDTRGEMQVAHMVHMAAAVIMMAMLAGHIYMGSIGVKGAYDGMRTGWVDEAWAKEHHALWYEDVKAGKIPVQRSGSSVPPAVQPAAGPST